MSNDALRDLSQNPLVGRLGVPRIPVLRRHTPGAPLPDGPAPVGVIGASLVLEYTAVGPAVNLASRLCEQADNGEILVDERTRQLTDQTPSRSRLTARAPMQLKGLADPVPMYALSAS